MFSSANCLQKMLMMSTYREATRAGFLYGPPIAGGPAFPSGTIGNLTAAADLESLEAELVPEQTMAKEDAELATEAFETGEVRRVATEVKGH